MRIESSEVSYVTAHRLASTTATIDKTVVRPNTLNATAGTVSRTGVPSITMDTVQLSARVEVSAGADREDLRNLDPKQRLAALAIEALLGRRINWVGLNPGAPSSDPTRTGAEEVRQRTEIHSESEQTTFQAEGMVRTADGRTVKFQAALTMQREFQSFTTMIESANSTDPLVVNLDGQAARLTDAKISFDLDSDGNPETISFAAAGSGFLVLDKNGDGKANNGHELFGPQTGHGFAELGSHDSDNNRWIDESDPVFSQLRIWTQDGFYSLAEKGIGAISTSSAETPFAIKDRDNSLQGDIRRTGIYLSENGTPGTIQQVDLVEG